MSPEFSFPTVMYGISNLLSIPTDQCLSPWRSTGESFRGAGGLLPWIGGHQQSADSGVRQVVAALCPPPDYTAHRKLTCADLCWMVEILLEFVATASGLYRLASESGVSL